MTAHSVVAISCHRADGAAAANPSRGQPPRVQPPSVARGNANNIMKAGVSLHCLKMVQPLSGGLGGGVTFQMFPAVLKSKVASFYLTRAWRHWSLFKLNISYLIHLDAPQSGWAPPSTTSHLKELKIWLVTDLFHHDFVFFLQLHLHFTLIYEIGSLLYIWTFQSAVISWSHLALQLLFSCSATLVDWLLIITSVNY